MKSLLVATLAAVLPVTAGAETHSLSFDEVVHEALSHGPEAAKIGASLSERAAEAFSTQVKENPTLNLDVEVPFNNPTGGREDTGVALTVSQAIRPSDFGQRTALAKVIQETASVDQVVALNELLANLAVLYSRAWQFQETESLLKDARGRVSRILKRITTAQGSAGAFGQGDIELLRSELETFEADGVAARGDLRRSLAELTKSTGSAIAERTFQRPPDRLPVGRDELERMVRESKLPIQRRYQLLKDLSRKRLEVTRLDASPAVTPQLGYSHHDDGADQVLLGISVPLPVFNRNQGEILKAQGELSVAEQGERYGTSDAIVAEAIQLYDAAMDSKKQVEIYESGVLPAKTRAVEAYSRQFEGGAASAFQLWQTQRELNDSRKRALELRLLLTESIAKLSILVGQPQF